MLQMNKELVVEAFKTIGFSEEDAISQLDDLCKLILLSVNSKIISENPDVIINQPNAEKLIKEKYAGKEAELAAVVTNQVQAYLDAITAGLAPHKKEEFMAKIQIAVATD